MSLERGGEGGRGRWRDETRLVNALILILATSRTCSSSNAGVESSWWIFAATVPLLALTGGKVSKRLAQDMKLEGAHVLARSGLLSWCDFGLGTDALDLSMAAEDACESNWAVRRSWSANG